MDHARRDRRVSKLRGAERPQRVLHPRRDDRANGDAARLPYSFNAKRIKWRRRLKMQDFHFRDLSRVRDQEVDEIGVDWITGRVKLHAFVQRAPKALRDAAHHLPFDDSWIDHVTTIMNADVLAHCNRAELRVDF